MKNCEKTLNLENLEHNINYIKSKLLPNVRVCAVVKADAYGHGVIPIVKHLLGKVDCFAVSNNFEASHILSALPDAKVIIIGPFNKYGLIKSIKLGAEISVSSLQDIKILSKLSKRLNKQIKLHIKLNTGMNRLGIDDKKELLCALGLIKSDANLALVGVFSHLGTSEKPKCKRTLRQLKVFESFLNLLPKDITKHIGNSGAVYANHLQYNMVRTGVSLYGYGNPNLKPVMSITSKIVTVRKLKRGEYIGYGNGHRLKKDTTVAVVSIGYGQGLLRSYAKNGYVLINGTKAKIIGIICMDMCFVDVTSLPNAVEGTTVTILGSDGQNTITADDMAKCCKTIGYEILCGFGHIKTHKILRRTSHIKTHKSH